MTFRNTNKYKQTLNI